MIIIVWLNVFWKLVELIKLEFIFLPFRTPFFGDDLYGGSTKLISRQALHCSHLSFIHPVCKDRVELESELASDMYVILLEK